MARFAYHHPANIYKKLFIRLTNKLFTGIMLVLIFLFISVSNVLSQEVRNLDEFLASLNAAKSVASDADGERLSSLVYDLHPILYLTNGELSNPLGGTPVCLTADLVSVSQLYQPKSTYNSIELITIIINEKGGATAKLELDKLQSFQNLRYVYFLSKSELCNTPDPACEAQHITDMVSGLSSSDIQVLYKVVTSN